MKKTVSAFKTGLTDHNTRVSLETVWRTAVENLFITTVIFMRATGLMTRQRGVGLIFTQTAQNMTVSGSMTNSMGLGRSLGPMVPFIVEIM